jgi:primary-amine oxidase
VAAAASAAAHPLDALTAAEIRDVVTLLRANGTAASDSRFVAIRLDPPEKRAVWNWRSGQKIERRAIAIMRRATLVSEATVDLRSRRLVGLQHRTGVQPAITGSEWNLATALVKADPRWQAAMQSRGIFDHRGIFCDALSVGSGTPPERPRLLKVPCYDARSTRNVYGRPIEGVMALVDLDRRVVAEVIDRGLVPISEADPSLEQERRRGLQPALRPVASSVAGGWNFAQQGEGIRWGNWSFHLSFDQRTGPVISTVRYRDGQRERPVIYQAHIAEMFVPYMDPDPNWTFRSYMDVGEYGFGSLASPLVAGIDCPAGAAMLSRTLPTESGEAETARNVMCVFERDSTVPLWRRYELVTGSHEARRDIELVVRTIPTVGNYDYVYDWVFTRKGEIKIDVGATGIAAAKGVSARAAREMGGTAAYGALVGPHLVAPNHDHFLSFRIDLDVDGQANSFVRDTLVSTAIAPSNARRSIWNRLSKVEPGELSLQAPHQPELWRVQNPAARTPMGHSPSFEIVGGHNTTSLLDEADGAQRRAAFSSRPLWVTAYKRDEVYAAGEYPNQGVAGQGLPRYLDGESIEGRDLVIWYTMGFHHVTRPEDWPVLPTVRHSMTLRPNGFFDSNPAISVQREPHAKPD